MRDLHPFGLARSQEPNHFHVHDSHLRQIQNKPRSVILELLVQFLDVLCLEVTTQANRGLSALGSLFDLHVPATVIETSAPAPMQVLCQRSFHGIDGVFCLPETTELSGILTFRKKATIAPWVNARPTRCQHLEAGSPFVTTRRGG
jgi:hypothetical protein